MSPDAAPLFAPFKLGDLQLPNRIVMAPLTRNRATHGTDAPRELNARYYRQRASAGLIDLRSLADQPAGPGLHLDAGLYSEAQVEGWREVTDSGA